jgi:hypothetical protein
VLTNLLRLRKLTRHELLFRLVLLLVVGAAELSAIGDLVRQAAAVRWRACYLEEVVVASLLQLKKSARQELLFELLAVCFGRGFMRNLGSNLLD